MSLAARLPGLMLLMLLPHGLSAQIPDKFTNLRVLPADISRDSLVAIMRGFSFALGVRCQYCHVGGDGISFEGVRFEDDGDEDKRKARHMLHMVQTINDSLLAHLPDRDQPAVGVNCVTCHHGLARPRTIEAVLEQTVLAAGADSAVAHYRSLRESYFGSGAYDFSAQRLMELARNLAVGGRTAEALRMLQLNAEYYPRSVATWLQIGEVHALRSERDAAIAAFEKALEIDPRNQQASRRLEQIRGR